MRRLLTRAAVTLTAAALPALALALPASSNVAQAATAFIPTYQWVGRTDTFYFPTSCDPAAAGQCKVKMNVDILYGSLDCVGCFPDWQAPRVTARKLNGTYGVFVDFATLGWVDRGGGVAQSWGGDALDGGSCCANWTGAWQYHQYATTVTTLDSRLWLRGGIQYRLTPSSVLVPFDARGGATGSYFQKA